MKISEEESKILWIIKGVALVSVFFAHTAGKYGYPSYEGLRDCLGLIGVPTFFIVSGYLFNKSANVFLFIKKKIWNVIFPWFLCSSCTYVLSIILNSQNLSLWCYIKWIFGIQTWYYFVPVLILIFILFTFFDNDWFVAVSFLFTILSLLLTQMFVDEGVNCNYINVFNWIGFFALGVFLRKKGTLDKLKTPLAYLFFIIAILGLVFVDRITNYWSIQSLIFEVIGFIAIVNMSYLIDRNIWISNIFQKVGKISYFVYLIHMQMVGVINSRLHIEEIHPALILVKPLIVFIIIVFIIEIFVYLLDKLKLYKFMKYLGIR